MHEFSLMESVLSRVRESAGENGINRISKVKIVVGQMTMAVPDSLQFAFEALTQAEEALLYADAVLEIEERPVRCLCKLCGNSFSPVDVYMFFCPECNSTQLEVTGGRELYLDFYEGEGE